MLLQVALLFITTKLMGAEIKGMIGLLVLNLTLIALLAGVVGGSAMVYLVPRHRIRHLLLIGYAWSAAVVPVASFVLALSGTEGFPGYAAFLPLALGEAFLAVHAPVLLGAKRVGAHNYSLVIKSLVTVGALAYVIWSRGNPDFDDFVQAYFSGLIAALAYSAFALLRLPNVEKPRTSAVATFRDLFKYGFPVQLGNLAQFLNYRLGFYLLEWFLLPGAALVRIGIYAAALQVSESLLQFSRSVSIVQYAEVSNSDDRGKALKLSLQFIKLNYSVTFLGAVVLLLLPNQWYTAFLGSEFHEVKAHLILLVPGLVALSVSGGISHFFSGVGLHRLNTFASALGLLCTAAVGIPAVAFFGTYGAVVTASLAYINLVSVQYAQLRKREGVTLGDFVITAGDAADFRRIVTGYLRLHRKPGNDA